MTTKPDAQLLMSLSKAYKPARRGVLTVKEQNLIKKELELDSRTDIELQNIRDMLVMFYGQKTDHLIQSGNTQEAMESMDAMSGACGAIDNEKIRRGLPV